MSGVAYIIAVLLFFLLGLALFGYAIHTNKTATRKAWRKAASYEKWCFVAGIVGFAFAPMFILEAIDKQNYATIFAAEFSLFFASGLFGIGLFPFLHRMHKHNKKGHSD